MCKAQRPLGDIYYISEKDGYNITQDIGAYKDISGNIHVVDNNTGMDISPSQLYHLYRDEVKTFDTFKSVEKEIDVITELFMKTKLSHVYAYERIQNRFNKLMEELKNEK